MFIAVDASLSSTGYAIFKYDGTLVGFGKINTTKKDGEADRRFKIGQTLANLIREYEINRVVVEGQWLGLNKKTGLQLAKLDGAIEYMAYSLNCKTDVIQPSVVRKILLNKGNATKEEVADYLRLSYYASNSEVQALGLLIDRTCKAKNSDMYDAIALGTAYILAEGD